MAKRILDEPSIQNCLYEIFNLLGFYEKKQSIFTQIFYSSNYFVLHDRGAVVFIQEGASLDVISLFDHLTELIKDIEKLLLPYGESVYEKTRSEKILNMILIFLLVATIAIFGFLLYWTIQSKP
jgi:hypothetical protein